MKDEFREANRRLIPLTHWSEYHQWPPIGGLRHLVFNAKQNGFDRVIRKVGKRVLIDEQAFFEWVDQTQISEISGPKGGNK